MTRGYEAVAVDVEAELTSPRANVRLIHFNFTLPPDYVMHHEGKLYLGLCLTPQHRSARGSFVNLSGRPRFRRMGELFVVPPGAELRAMSDECDALSTILCRLDSTPLLELFEKAPDLSDPLLLANTDFQSPRVKRLLLRLAQEAREPGFGSQLLVESISAQVAVELTRVVLSDTQSTPSGGLAPWQLRVIDERLKELETTPTLAELAELCRLSIRQLSRGFQASRGCSIGLYVTNSQLERAKSMLATDASIASIATTLGFSSSSNFCVAFRRAMDMSPGEFRRTMLGARSIVIDSAAGSLRNRTH